MFDGGENSPCVHCVQADQAELKSMVIKYLQAQNVELMAEVEPQVDDIIAEL